MSLTTSSENRDSPDARNAGSGGPTPPDEQPRPVVTDRSVTLIRIDVQYCKGCGICVHFCPKQVLELSAEPNSRGYCTPCVKDAAACTACRQCMLLCPDFAIFIVEEAEDGDE